MSDKYDNWERLVTSVLRRQRDREIAMMDSCSVSSASSVSDPNSPSRHLDYNYSQSYHHHQLRMEYTYLMLNHRQWKEMLPPDKPELIWTSIAPLRFFLDQRSGKNCFLLGAARMCHWPTVEIKESRFSKAVAFAYPSNLHIRALIKAQILSPDTHYTAYLVFQSRGTTDAFMMETFRSERTIDAPMMENSEDYIHLESTIEHSERLLDREISECGTDRGDGWMEIKVGDFYIHHQQTRQEKVALVLRGMDIPRDKEILVEGLEFRPRS